MENQMIINKKMVRRNKALRRIQKEDRKLNRDKKLDRNSVLKRNIGKVVVLSSEELLGNVTTSNQNPITDMNISEFIRCLEQTKLTGMSGNGFPVAHKMKTYLSSASHTKKGIVIINGAECEPGLLHDAWLMRHKGKEIMEGAAYLKEILKPERMILATRGKQEWISGNELRGVEAIRVPLQYPMGEEHFLIEQLLGIKIAKEIKPAEQGILVINVQTVYQIARILNGSYDGGHFVNLDNLNTGEARVAYVNSETNIMEMLKLAFGTLHGTCVAGEGVTSAANISNEETFTNTISFAAITGEVLISNEKPCKKCGGCSKKCPMGISVRDIVLAREKNPDADISEWRPEQCIHCGTCTYFCMAGKDVASYVTK